MAEDITVYFTRYPKELGSRLDENYNNPEYDEIEVLLSRTKFDIAQLGKSQELLEKRFVLYITSGKTPDKIRYQDEGIPFVGATSVRDGKVYLELAPRIPRKIHETILRASQLQKDDILITMAGHYIGRCAVYEGDEECNVNQAIAVLRVNQDNIVPRYLVKYFNSHLGQLFFGKLQHVAGQPNINLDEIVRIKVTLPSKPEQEQIINIVLAMEAESLPIDTKIEQLRDQAGSTLLRELEITLPEGEIPEYYYRTGKGESSYFVLPFNKFGDRISYHSNAPKQSLLEKLTGKYSTTTLSKIVATRIHRGEAPFYAEDGEIRCIKTVDVKEGYIDYDNCLKTTRKCFEQFPNAHADRGDVLVSSTGHGSIGKVAVHEHSEPVMIENHVAIVRLVEGYNPYFVTYFLLSHLGKLQFEKWWTGSSGQIELQPTDLGKFIVPDCTDSGVSQRRQELIASQISQVLSKVVELQTQRNNILEKSEAEFVRLLGIAT